MNLDNKHNLNIQSYSFEELLGLFNLTSNFNINDLKIAKKKVLWMHPDKSKLSSEYFLFYKKAFSVIVGFYEEKTKQSREVPNTEIKYEPSNSTTEDKRMNKVINKIKSKDFNNKFNELFEQNMSSKPDSSKNDWFYKEESIYDVNKNITPKGMTQEFENLRKKSNEMIRYRGVENLYSRGAGGTNFYDEDENPFDQTGYISSDLFSKLKYDDLRRVHKDQTLIPVGESDFDKITKYKSVDHLSQERGLQDLTPMEKITAERKMNEEKEKIEKEIMRRQYESKLRTIQYEEKNNTIKSHFLRLT
jgi:hypothetical protein